MEPRHFLSRYKSEFESIQGMFSIEAGLLMAAYAQLAAEEGVRADTLEIGVHQGLSAILVAALRADGGRFVAVDLFEDLQDRNVSHSGAGHRQQFLSNMARFHDSEILLRVIAAPSSSLEPFDLGQTYSFCHVDGGHSAEETYADLLLCSKVLMPGGVLVIDDYFNPNFPGVAEGAIQFMLGANRDVLTPVAIGFNKVVFQKGSTSALNDRFPLRFPKLPHATVQLWGKPALHFGSNFSTWIDLRRSTPHQLVADDQTSMQVRLRPDVSSLRGYSRQVLSLPVSVENASNMTLCFSNQPIGLSYHLLTGDGQILAHDNRREYFHNPLHPGQQRIVSLPIACPPLAGQYQLEIDLVWEGVCWFKERDNAAPVIPLQVL